MEKKRALAVFALFGILIYISPLRANRNFQETPKVQQARQVGQHKTLIHKQINPIPPYGSVVPPSNPNSSMNKGKK